MSVLSTLCQYDELWELICSNLSGDSLIAMSRVSMFAQATTATPAFQLLAGLTSDGEVVEWLDPANVMSTRLGSVSASLIAYRSMRLASDFARCVAARSIAEFVLKGMTSPYKPRYLQNSREDTVRLHHCLKGPARPPSALLSNSPKFRYTIFNIAEISASNGAAVFGLRKGYMYPPYWRALCYAEDDSDDDKSNADHKNIPRFSYESDDDDDENDEEGSGMYESDENYEDVSGSDDDDDEYDAEHPCSLLDFSSAF
jgi:hypothetical protein